MLTATYALEQLYVDQEHDWVVDAIPAVLAWVPVERRAAASKRLSFCVFPVVGSHAELLRDQAALRVS